MKITFEWMRNGSSHAERNDPRRQTLAFSQDDLDVNVLFVAAFKRCCLGERFGGKLQQHRTVLVSLKASLYLTNVLLKYMYLVLCLAFGRKKYGMLKQRCKSESGDDWTLLFQTEMYPTPDILDKLSSDGYKTAKAKLI